MSDHLQRHAEARRFDAIREEAERLLALDRLGLAAVLHMRRAEAEETLANPLELTGLQRVARALERVASDSDGVAASRLRAVARGLAETSDWEEPRRSAPRGA